MSATFEVGSGALAGVPWTVLSIVGEEAISELFRFFIRAQADRADLSMATGQPDLEPVDRALCGQQVSFALEQGGTLRYGIVASARIDVTSERGGRQYVNLVIEVVPRAWILTQRRNSRIFQGVYINQIVSHVLVESGISHSYNLAGTYPRRIFCTQYDETDWDFITRLFAEEGILFYFEHTLNFTGGPEPSMSDPSTWLDGLSTAATVLGAIGNVAGLVGGAVGDNEKGQAIGVGASALNVAADLIKPIPPDPEDDAPKSPGAYSCGPAGWAASQGTDVLVFVDGASYPPIPNAGIFDAEVALTLRSAASLETDENAITEISPTGRLRTRAAHLREFDFRRPMYVLESKAEVTASVDAVPQLTSDALRDLPLPDVYGHHSQYDKPYLADGDAKTRLEQIRADADTFSGRGYCSQLFAGGTFTLTNAAHAHLATSHFAVVRVRHELHAHQDAPAASGDDARFTALARGCARAIHEALHRREILAEEAIGDIIRREIGPDQDHRPRRTYRNRFEVVAATVPFRPPPAPPLVRNVFESAIVVGPRGLPPAAPGPPDPNDPGSGDAAKEIYVDKYGRVKIQFHWDLEGTYDDTSSCWVRPSQTWAGAGFGFQFVPRVGMEVLVGFFRGDPDRPVILGSVYNATHATPEPLPQRNTRSGIRTQTSPGGGGFNELSFEDGRGAERVNIHAQKDFEVTVNDTHLVNVKNHQKVTVATNLETEVGADQLTAVGGNQASIVGGNQSDHVRGQRTVDVSGNETHTVAGNALRSVDGVSAETVKTDLLTSVGGNLNVSVGGTAITQIGGADPDTPASSVTYVQGKSFHTSTSGTLIRVERKDATTSLRLECGDSFIEIGPQKITLSSPTIEGLGDKNVKLASKKSNLSLDQDGAAMHGKSAALTTPSGAKMGVDGSDASTSAPGNAVTKASQIALKSGGGGGGDDQDQKTAPSQSPNLMLAFFHGVSGDPIRSTPYRVIIDDLVYDGSTDGGGVLRVYAPDAAKVAFVTLWANKTFAAAYPTGPLQWLVHLGQDLGDAATPKGARVRLRNLGYDPGAKLDRADIDDATRLALLEFQLDRDLAPTGKLEDDTQKQLTKSYGG